MKATYNPTRPTKYTRSHRRENGGYLQSLIVIDLANLERWGHETPSIHGIVELRTYGTAARNTACLWVHGETVTSVGSGSAGGYGYHRISAAAGEAITNAGFDLDTRIDGVGDAAIRSALLAVARAAGALDPVLITAHA